MEHGRSSGSIPTSCRPRSRSSTSTSSCSARVGSPPTGPATPRCASTSKTWPERVWAVEGSNGAGRPLAQRLLEDGEQVVDVPAKLAARVRLFDTGHNRKTDAHDAHAVAVVAVRTKTLRVLQLDGELEALRMLTDRREALTRRRVQTVDRLQALLAELLPGQAKRDITTGQAKAMLAFCPAPRHRRQDPPPHRRRRAGRTGRGRGQDQEGHRRAQGDRARPRLTPDGPPRRRPRRGCPGPGRRRRRRPGSPTATGSRPGPAPHHSTPPPASRTATGCREPGTGG